MEFKEKLKKLRKENGVTQEALANAIHVSRSAIAKWEAGLGLPQEDSLDALCEFFQIEKEEMIRNDIKESDMIDKNIKIHRQKKKIWILLFALLLVILIAGCFMVMQRQPKVFVDDTDLYSTVQVPQLEDYSYVGEISSVKLLDNAYGYSYQDIFLERFRFTKESDLYFLRVKESFTPGGVAYANHSIGYNKDAILVECSLQIEFDPKESIHPIFSFPNFDSGNIILQSRWSDEVLLEENTYLFGYSIKKIGKQYGFYYKEDFKYILFPPTMDKILRKLEYENHEYSSYWKYQMVEEKSKNATFDMYSYFIFEINSTVTDQFHITLESKATSKNHITRRKHIVNFQV